MSDHESYSDEELNRYFRDREARQRQSKESRKERHRRRREEGGVGAYFHHRFDNPRIAQAALALSAIVVAGVIAVLSLGIYFLALSDELPSIEKLENPSYQLATVAYTADGQELARYARQNRSWATIDEISPHAINALVAIEDHRFREHWGLDLFRTASATIQSALSVVGLADVQGGSTITQQLARNLYNDEIGFDRSVGRKLKEMSTAIELERRYTKDEIIEMYLNTVEFGQNAWGIESAAHTYFGTTAAELDPSQSATLVGMLRAITYFNPIRNPDNAQRRRNLVLSQMVKHDFLDEGYYRDHRDTPVQTDYRSAELTASLAPYFAEHVRNWLGDWSRENGRDFYSEGLIVYTTLDSELQELADAAVQEQLNGLQTVVNYEWSQSGPMSSWHFGRDFDPYERQSGYEPFRHFWNTHPQLLNEYITSSERYRKLTNRGADRSEALEELLDNQTFMDSLKIAKTRIEAGLVSVDPRSGHVRAWVGGRDFSEDKYDKVAIARRQTGSTFKPFVYTAAIDNGYSPYYTVRDDTVRYRDPSTGDIWSPTNFAGYSNQMKTLTEGLAESINTVTAKVMTQLVNPSEVAFYARRMGIRKSPLEEVPSLSLGTSDVSLLEMTAAYSTLANGGLYYEPTVVTRIEDQNGNVLFEAEPAPEEALSESTAYTVVDMMRGVIDYGTGQRINWQWGLGDYDLAGKTGTTQESADGWFMLMHPELVTGSWVGFNDRRIQFRSGSGWGQGAWNALPVVGNFVRRVVDHPDVSLSNEQFPLPEHYGGQPGTIRQVSDDEDPDDRDDGRVGW